MKGECNFQPTQFHGLYPITRTSSCKIELGGREPCSFSHQYQEGSVAGFGVASKILQLLHYQLCNWGWELAVSMSCRPKVLGVTKHACSHWGYFSIRSRSCDVNQINIALNLW